MTETILTVWLLIAQSTHYQTQQLIVVAQVPTEKECMSLATRVGGIFTNRWHVPNLVSKGGEDRESATQRLGCFETRIVR